MNIRVGAALVEKASRRHAQRLGELRNHRDRRIAPPIFNGREVCPVDTHHVGKDILRVVLGAPEASHVLREPLSDVIFHLPIIAVWPSYRDRR